MWVRKVIFNFVVAFIMFPIFISAKYWGNIISGNYRYYDTYYPSLRDYLFVTIYHPLAYPLLPFLLLLFIFIPFQFVKDYYSSKKKELSYFTKVAILSGMVLILIIVFGMFTNIWDYPWYINLRYLFYALLFGIVFTTLLHFAVDNYVEKKAEQ